MMKGLAVLLALLCSQSALAVGLEFRDLPLPQFAEAVFRQVLNRDYVISSMVAQSTERVSISVKDVDSGKALELVSSVLRLHGVAVIERDDVLFLEPLIAAGTQPPPASVDIGDEPSLSIASAGQLSPEPRDIEIYVPRHQAPEMLAQVARFAGAEVAQGGENRFPVVAFTGTAAAIEKARTAMEKLDRPPLSVRLRAAILEVTDGAEEQRSLSGILTLFSGRLGISFGSSSSGNAITIKGASIDAILSAVDGDNRFRYLAEPALKVVDREQAKLVVGSEVPVRGAVTTDNNGNLLQSVEYRTAGVQLTVEPKIYADVVVAKIGQEISSFSTTTTSGIDSPTILKRSALTTVDLREGEVIALAGLDETRDNESSSGLSWLPFTLSRSHSSSRSKILLLLEMSRDVHL